MQRHYQHCPVDLIPRCPNRFDYIDWTPYRPTAQQVRNRAGRVLAIRQPVRSVRR